MTGQGEPTTLLALRHPGKRRSERESERESDSDSMLSGAERRERAAMRKVAVWGAVLSAAAVLLVSLMMGAMRGVG